MKFYLEYIDIDIFLNYIITKLTFTNIKYLTYTNWTYNRYIKLLVKTYGIKLIKLLTIKNISSYYRNYTDYSSLLNLCPKTDTKLPLTYTLKK
jgi:hypothetical protein